MTETTIAVEGATDEIKPFVDEQDREITHRSDSNPGTAANETSRAAIITPKATTGRHKETVVRMRIVPDSGQWTINGCTLEDYFLNKVHQQLVSDPFATAGVTGSYNVITCIDGGGVTEQADALRLDIARALNETGTEASRPVLKKAGILTRDARVKEYKKADLKRAHEAPQYSKR